MCNIVFRVQVSIVCMLASLTSLGSGRKNGGGGAWHKQGREKCPGISGCWEEKWPILVVSERKNALMPWVRKCMGLVVSWRVNAFIIRVLLKKNDPTSVASRRKLAPINVNNSNNS